MSRDRDHPPDGPRHLRRRRSTAALLAGAAGGAAAAAAAATVGCLLLWSVVPVAAGYRPNLVTSDSMRPAIAAGDVVLTRATAASGLRPGQVVLVHDASRAADVLHRVRRIDGGAIVTQGDANPTPDASPFAPDDVAGVGRIVVPSIGRPALAAARNPLAATLAVVGVALVSTAVRRARDERERGQRVRAAATIAAPIDARSSSSVTYGGIA